MENIYFEACAADVSATTNNYLNEGETPADKNEFSCSTPVNHLNQSDCLPSPVEVLSNLNKINMSSNSLIEFEQYEKMVEQRSEPPPHDSTLDTSTAYQSLFNAPINQMENLLANLRSNYNGHQQLNAKSDEQAIKSINDSFNFKSMVHKILPMSGQMFTGEPHAVPKKEAGFHQYNENNGYFRKGDQLAALENRLENETLRRQHCEKQIYELNEHLLELQQQLAVANCLDKKRDLFVQNMDVTLHKILDSWKRKEAQIEKSLHKTNLEKHEISVNEKKLKMKTQFMEQELKKTGDNLVLEKVKSQEFQNEVNTLKKALNDALQSFIDKSNEVERLNEQVAAFKAKNQLVTDEINKLNVDFKSLNEELKQSQEEYSSKTEILNNKNLVLIEKNEKIKMDYENLIKEAKFMISESEKQYKQLANALDSEKISKDSLQVEINMLEEKLENKVKCLANDYEQKLSRSQAIALEREKSLLESHRNELEQIHAQSKSEYEKLKQKHHEEVQTKVNEYEMKLTNLSLSVDSHRTEIERLKRANSDLENDRNQIRQSLKQMLELQMKEAMQLLGTNKASIDSNIACINSVTATDHTHLIEQFEPSLSMLSYENSINDILNKIQSTKDTLIQPDTKKSQIDFSPQKTARTQVEPLSTQESIKDEFILSKIDLINQYYKFDTKTTAETNTLNNQSFNNLNKSALSSSTSFSSSSSLNNTNNNNNQIVKQIETEQVIVEEKTTEVVRENFKNLNSSLVAAGGHNISSSAMASARANDLRHFIEMLLVRSPASEADQPDAVEHTNSKPFRHMEASVSEIVASTIYNDNTPVKKGHDSYYNDDDATENFDSSDEDEEDDLPERANRNSAENHRKHYSHHDISDVELGYTKRQSSEYYDDVKRTLNFDEDEDEHDKLQNDEFNNATSTPTKITSKQRLFMQKTSSVRDVSKLSTSLMSTDNKVKATKKTNSGAKANKVKDVKKKNLNLNSSSSSRSHSMISLMTTPSSILNSKDVIATTQANKKITVTNNNTNKRIWK